MQKSDLVMAFNQIVEIRAVVDDDADGLIRLISNCFSEYEGVVIDLDDLDRDLLAYETTLKTQNGEGFVAIAEDGQIVGSVAYAPSGTDTYELKRLYLSETLRGTGIGLRLLHQVEDSARRRGGRTMDAWSDTRFVRAHRFYEREGYIKQSETRDLNDISNSVEFYFRKTL